MFKKSKVAVVALTSLLLAACGGTQGSTTSSTTSDSTSIANPVTVTVTDDTVRSTIDSSFLPGVTAQRIRLTVWSETESHPLFKELISEFAKKYYYDESSNAKYEFIVTIGDEFSDAATKITQDLDVAPDVFGFPDDQLGKLVDAGAIQEITGSTKTWVNENNVQASVSSATYNNKLYAFPQTADNGYFLYYNKNYLTADDVKTVRWNSRQTGIHQSTNCLPI
ncbi:MAG: extracellular solute-binding protein [Bacilli bacterium]|jgi:arabinogalactan oligomer/maltooligosaccharide transport system substrate-binding protein|nr:extracellular solute-binding protein [Bacilli bacterium]